MSAPDLNKILGQAVKKVAEIEKNLKVKNNWLYILCCVEKKNG